MLRARVEAPAAPESSRRHQQDDALVLDDPRKSQGKTVAGKQGHGHDSDDGAAACRIGPDFPHNRHNPQQQPDPGQGEGQTGHPLGPGPGQNKRASGQQRLNRPLGVGQQNTIVALGHPNSQQHRPSLVALKLRTAQHDEAQGDCDCQDEGGRMRDEG